MTGKATINAILIAAGVVAGVGIWTAAILLPEPAARTPAPLLAAPEWQPEQSLASLAPDVSAPTPGVQTADAMSAPPAETPFDLPAELRAELRTQLPADPPAAPSPPAVAAQVDPAVFGALRPSFEATPPSRVSLLESAGPLSLTSTSFASAPLQSIGATFSDPVAGLTLPELGGAAALDGPADAGLDEPVLRADAPGPAVAPQGKIIAIDASEGTKLDPLRQRNWDLNAVQVIPPSVTLPKR